MMAEREITGRHVLIGFVGFFGVIVGVNGFMAWSAINTFPGLEVKNGYVASQTFNDRKAAQQSLGWRVEAGVTEGVLHVAFTDDAGMAVRPARLELSVGRPTEDREDVLPDLVYRGGRFEAPFEMGAGRWTLRLRAYDAEGTLFQQRRSVLAEDG